MAGIDIFFQGEHVREVAHLEADPLHTIAVIKATIIERHGGSEELLLFVEDSDDPLEPTVIIGELFKAGSGKLHAHRCRHVEVTVSFGGQTVKSPFSPSATIARVKHWAAEKQFGMTPADAAEHRLQIAGSTVRPTPGTHIGTLVSCPACRVAFDLVPDKRVQGFSPVVGE